MTLFIFGFGYSASFIAHEVDCVGTKRVDVDAPPIFAWDGKQRLSEAGEAALDAANAVLISVPPDENGDPVFCLYAEKLKHKKWLGYFSSTAVYGDHNGEWIDETTNPDPLSASGKQRLMAEEQWLSLNAHIFRLSGIYGPGRSAFDRARANAPIIEKTGHVMNRIHVSDIANVIVASLAKPTPGEIFNLADDVPAASAEVLAGAYHMLGRTPPAPIPFEDADLTPMAAGFFASNKRIRNNKIKDMLGIRLRYPDWKTGILDQTNP